jgi:hypothetical protein
MVTIIPDTAIHVANPPNKTGAGGTLMPTINSGSPFGISSIQVTECNILATSIKALIKIHAGELMALKSDS